VLTSITGVRKWEIELNADSDQQPVNVFDRNYGATTQKQFSQEIRIASPQGQTVEYVAGLYYYWQDVDSFTSQVFSVPGVVRLGRDATPSFETTNVAAFANATVSVTDAFRLIAGGRYTYEKLDGDFTRVVTPGTDGVFTPDIAFEFDTDADEPSWRFGAQYDIGDAMVYATVSRGFKGPTANILADFNETDTDAILVDPEFATSYEVGLKSAWLDGRVTANLAVFDTEFEDFQAQTYDQTRDPALFRITNAGELTTRGVELELVALPTDRLLVSTSVSYVDSEFEEFRTVCYPFQTVEQGCIPVPGVPGASDTDASGNALNGSPEWSYTAAVSYQRPLNDTLNWHVLGSYYWQDEVNYSTAGDPNTLQDDYGIFHLNVGVGSQDGRWQLSAFARNLFDKHFVNSIFGTPLGFAAAPNTAASYSQGPTWEGRRIVGLSLALSLD
jgi:iron complex outermembrane receptor protein